MIEANVDVQAKIIASMLEVMTSDEVKYWFSSQCEVCC